MSFIAGTAYALPPLLTANGRCGSGPGRVLPAPVAAEVAGVMLELSLGDSAGDITATAIIFLLLRDLQSRGMAPTAFLGFLIAIIHLPVKHWSDADKSAGSWYGRNPVRMYETLAALGAAVVAALSPAASSQVDDAATVAALDIAYQAAVKRNDADAMDEILHEKFALVLGSGKVVSRDELIDSARRREVEYEVQDEDPGTQTVRVWGDTAVVTARLRIKGTQDGQPFERRLWFSDTYVRTPAGWRYAFAQASLPLPNE